MSVIFLYLDHLAISGMLVPAVLLPVIRILQIIGLFVAIAIDIFLITLLF